MSPTGGGSATQHTDRHSGPRPVSHRDRKPRRRAGRLCHHRRVKPSIDPDALLGTLSDSHLALYEPEDAAELVVLQRCCWVQEALANQTLDIPALHESQAEVEAWAASWVTVVLRRRGRLVGAVRGRQEGTHWHVGRLMVAPDLAGRGLGTALLRLIESCAPADVTEFVLFTGARSLRNHRTYERAGYRLASSAVPGAVPGHIAGAVVMTRSVH